MTDAPLTQHELIDIFWQSDAADRLAEMGSICRVHYRRPLGPISIRSEPEIVIDMSVPPIAEFYLVGQHFGDELWVSVVAEGHVIVRPFPLHHRERLPSMRPKGQTIRDSVPCLN